MFRKAVSTIEGWVRSVVGGYLLTVYYPHSVKADFLFSYQPPINMLALCIMLPASRVLSPRWFHKASFPVFIVRGSQ